METHSLIATRHPLCPRAPVRNFYKFKFMMLYQLPFGGGELSGGLVYHSLSLPFGAVM